MICQRIAVLARIHAHDDIINQIKRTSNSYLRNMKIKLSELKSLIRQSIKEHLDPDTISDDDVLDNTEPKFHLNPETTLMHKLFASRELRTKFKGKSPEEVAQLLGVEQEPAILDLIDRLMNSLFYR